MKRGGREREGGGGGEKGGGGGEGRGGGREGGGGEKTERDILSRIYTERNRQKGWIAS